MFYSSSMYTANGSRLTRESNGFKMLQLISETGGASKYDCLTIALGKKGSRSELRGYYSCYFRGLVDNKVLNPSVKGIYTLTDHGQEILNKITEGV